ncbi:MAG: radical SAM protein [Actinobacteria bacterium]|nr:radical SAM protein [Actinomycetota bacterium]
MREKEIRYSKLSIVDDIGRVFHWRSGIYRGIYPRAVHIVREMFTSGLVDELIQRGLFPNSRLTDYTLEIFPLVVEHDLVPFVTYPHEWSFDMFRDAACAVLEVSEIAVRFGFRMKDCHPYNVLFARSRPLYVDLGSFVKANAGDDAFPVAEFLGSYWYPLFIWSTGDYFMAQRIISSEHDMMSQTSWLLYRLPVLRKVSARWQDRTSFVYERVMNRAANVLRRNKYEMLAGLASRLPAESLVKNSYLIKQKIKRFATPQPTSAWHDYHDEHFEQNTLKTTPRFERIIEIVRSLGCESVVELGGNQGLVSLLLLNHTQVSKVVCTDSDNNAINRLYTRCHEAFVVPEGKTLQPAVINVKIPKINFFTVPPTERFRADLVTALAITHHLTLSQMLSIQDVMRIIAGYSHHYALIEFMPLGLWNGTSAPALPDWYSLEWFHKAFLEYFDLILNEQTEVNRILYVGRVKNSGRGSSPSGSSLHAIGLFSSHCLTGSLMTQVDVLFVIPPVLKFIAKSSDYYPLGLGYMVSSLRQRGITAEIYNADVYERSPFESLGARLSDLVTARLLRRHRRNTFNVDFARSWPTYHENVPDHEHTIWREVRSALKRIRPKIIGISSKVVDIPSTFMLARMVKQILPDTPVIVGGPSAITCSEYLLRNDAIDLLVFGEGEETICELAQAILSGTLGQRRGSILGIGYRAPGGSLVKNGQRPLIQNLDALPFPDRNAVFMIDRRGRTRYVRGYRDVLTSRGCPYQCTFCCAYVAWGSRKPRFRSIVNIVDELEYLYRECNQTNFTLWDDLFTADRRRVIAFCDEIAKRKLDFTWLCLSRINTIDEELLRTMKSAGCREIQIGIESGSNRLLTFIRKDITRAMIFEKVPILQRAGIPWRIFLIIGFPTETRAEMDETMSLIEEMKPTYVDLSLFCPYPGTELHRNLRESGKLGDEFMKSDMWYPYNNYTSTMSDSDFQAYAFRALKMVDDYNDVSLNAAVCDK